MQTKLKLNIPEMDSKHDEFIEIFESIRSSTDDNFMSLFEEMIAHTKEHFAFEEEIIRQQAFYGIQEHLDEHSALLNEMIYFYEKAKKIPAFGRSYINDYAYGKFERHVINIDSQLAMFLKGLTET